MRILLVCPYYWPEPFRVARVAADLKARGHEVEVLTGLPNYPAGRFYAGYGARGPFHEEHEGIAITRVPLVPRGAGGAIRLLLNYLSFAVTASWKALSLGRRRWDVVFVFQLSPVTAILPAVVMRALYGTPVAIWVQDLWPESVASTGFGRSRLLYAAARAISAWLYRRCDRIAGTSRAFRARLEALGVPGWRFSYLPQWAEDFFGERAKGPALAAPRWASGFPIMFAGNLGRVQALETVVAAAEQVRDDPEIRWVFVGDGSQREWLETEVSRRGLQDRIFLLGRHPAEEMPAFFAKAGAMLVSLKRDDTMALTIPAKVQSYLAAGRPILGSIDGEGARVIEEAGAGLTAPAGDPAALAELARRMKSLPAAERAAMGERGRAYSARHFSRERCVDELERLLHDALQVGAADPAIGPT
ncbi:glycosyltransferase family 4 protein [Anaeromyxobacter oryzisoli]|uniref:glycosyltransferase family 4 protein n=1 Tax=Anaeromyxobacter oryzisoli TaxID=2925408 RepID=UPI001F5695E4|nr:glycosyltransferase family 4 protein [Anaeromyxobacter sp. SG63]